MMNIEDLMDLLRQAPHDQPVRIAVGMAAIDPTHVVDGAALRSDALVLWAEPIDLAPDRQNAVDQIVEIIGWLNRTGEHARAVELHAAVYALDTPDAGIRVAAALHQDATELSEALGVEAGALHWHELIERATALRALVDPLQPRAGTS